MDDYLFDLDDIIHLHEEEPGAEDASPEDAAERARALSQMPPLPNNNGDQPLMIGGRGAARPAGTLIVMEQPYR